MEVLETNNTLRPCRRREQLPQASFLAKLIEPRHRARKKRGEKKRLSECWAARSWPHAVMKTLFSYFTAVLRYGGCLVQQFKARFSSCAVTRRTNDEVKTKGCHDNVHFRFGCGCLPTAHSLTHTYARTRPRTPSPTAHVDARAHTHTQAYLMHTYTQAYLMHTDARAHARALTHAY